MTLLLLLLILLGGPAVMLAPFAIGHALNKPAPRMKETLR
ncbi:hypothetical protein GA0074694_1078 [Micromonospora inyonensis]|uniref:Uncharacterized protein n=1 Tax=Micromonospora inyonensis TaxID=47866 RepID=A0A1C6RDW1_9ACTN|nr:hypothetical protein GA0074694_1078 [Micromonospora inyonensis]